MFFWKNLLPEKLPEELLPDEQFVLPEKPSSGRTKLPEEVLPITFPEEGSSGRTNCSFGRIFFQKKDFFFLISFIFKL